MKICLFIFQLLVLFVFVSSYIPSGCIATTSKHSTAYHVITLSENFHCNIIMNERKSYVNRQQRPRAASVSKMFMRTQRLNEDDPPKTKAISKVLIAALLSTALLGGSPVNAADSQLAPLSKNPYDALQPAGQSYLGNRGPNLQVLAALHTSVRFARPQMFPSSSLFSVRLPRPHLLTSPITTACASCRRRSRQTTRRRSPTRACRRSPRPAARRSCPSALSTSQVRANRILLRHCRDHHSFPLPVPFPPRHSSRPCCDVCACAAVCLCSCVFDVCVRVRARVCSRVCAREQRRWCGGSRSGWASST